MEYKLPELPYAYKDLEPYIDAGTMEIHHGKHHATYVAKLNEAITGITGLDGKNIEEVLQNLDKLIPSDKKQAVINHGGGHVNHSMFWEIMTPLKGQTPGGKLMEALNSTFGSFENFKEKFSEKSLSLFGSGWVFLIADKSGKLALKRHSFQNSPYLNGNTPLMGLDLWEHAYYLKYQNRRVEYVTAWWNVVNWKKVEENFNKVVDK